MGRRVMQRPFYFSRLGRNGKGFLAEAFLPVLGRVLLFGYLPQIACAVAEFPVGFSALCLRYFCAGLFSLWRQLACTLRKERIYICC